MFKNKCVVEQTKRSAASLNSLYARSVKFVWINLSQFRFRIFDPFRAEDNYIRSR